MTIKEEFDQAAMITGLTDSEEGHEEKTSEYINHLHQTVPHANAFVTYADRHIDKVLTRQVRRFNGVEFVDNEDAIAKTKPQLKLAWLAVIWQSLASGVLVGQQDPRFIDPESLLSEDFELASVQYANEAAEDTELMELTSQGFEQMVEEVQITTGFSLLGKGRAMVMEAGKDMAPPTDDMLKHLTWKVWDLWSMIFTAGAHAYFATGYEIGKARREEAILKGILEASEETDNGG